MGDQERREYPNPPIVEGLCQFTFSERLAWSVATPGLLFEQLRDMYPREPEAQEVVQATLASPEGGDTNLAINRGEQRFIYRDDTGTRLFVANAVTASANSLKPYEGWPSLKARLSAGFERLDAVSAVPGISRVSIRYINRIAIRGESGSVNTDDYFTLPVRTAQEGGAFYSSFITRVQSVLPDEHTQVNSVFASVSQEQPDEQHFLLDLELLRAFDDEPLGLDQAYEVADELKVIENREFESSITDKARELFR